jgi:AcrR family transcriptional regulator
VSIAALVLLAMLSLGMAVKDRRTRERAARRQLILGTARRLAEAEGWDAVTTRRLSTEIEYSQPVLYKHFSCMEDIAEALAIEGFGELADVLHTARTHAGAARCPLKSMAFAYISFARDNPALYDAMFIRASKLRFGVADTPPPLVAAFAELQEAVEAVANGTDVDTLAEVFWTALHGLVTLARGGRLRQENDAERIELLIAQFCLAP